MLMGLKSFVEAQMIRRIPISVSSVDANGQRISLPLMAEEADPPRRPSTPPPKYLEVYCKSSGKIRRFAVGTDAGFSLSIINRKAGAGSLAALYVEAVKEGEEPINFSPNSPLLDYGPGWKLQTVTEADYVSLGARSKGEFRLRTNQVLLPHGTGDDSSRISNPIISPMYFGKIIIAFILMFVLGTIFTLALDNLPQFILFIKSRKWVIPSANIL